MEKSAKRVCFRCSKQLEECACLGNGDHPWDCRCTRCLTLETTGKFPPPKRKEK